MVGPWRLKFQNGFYSSEKAFPSLRHIIRLERERLKSNNRASAYGCLVNQASNLVGCCHLPYPLRYETRTPSPSGSFHSEEYPHWINGIINQKRAPAITRPPPNLNHWKPEGFADVVGWLPRWPLVITRPTTILF